MTDSSPPAPPNRPRRGFALPLAILMVALVTIGLVASFSAASGELSTAQAQQAQARAYSYAQRGLEAFIARRNDPGFCPHCQTVNNNPNMFPMTQETAYVAFRGGFAVVKATPVYLDTLGGKGTYLVTSVGTDGGSTLFSGLTTRNASRTVGVLASYTRLNMNVLAGWTSLSGIQINGNSATISGIDACGRSPNVAGLSVPYDSVARRADLSQSNSNWRPTGNPPYDTLNTFARESSLVKIDWNSIKNGTALPADYNIGSDAFPSAAIFAAADSLWFPVIHVYNAPGSVFALPNAGRGILIVDNDLTISGSNQWNGIILVGGALRSNGNNVSSGATVSGLNYLTGGRPANSVTSSADDATADGTKQYVYSSCDVSKATRGASKYYILSNTWMDNLATY